jgi:hypothetical protein
LRLLVILNACLHFDVSPQFVLGHVATSKAANSLVHAEHDILVLALFQLCPH